MSAFPQTQFAATTLLTAGMIGPQPQPGPSFWSSAAEGLTIGGQIASVFGAATSAIGTYYNLKSQQNQLKMQSQNAAFQAEMSRINRRAAEFTAVEVGRQGQLQAGRYTMAAICNI